MNGRRRPTHNECAWDLKHSVSELDVEAFRAVGAHGRWVS
jgi:hypothetical protein